MTYYVVRVDSDYIADGKPYIVQGGMYVPFTSSLKDARKYKTFAAAKLASQRRGANMYGHIVIIKCEEE